MDEATPEPAVTEPCQTATLGYLFRTFLKIGSISFGGYMSLMAVVEATLVVKDRTLRRDEMLDGMVLASLLPGPQAVNCVAFCGYRLRGSAGAAIAVTAVTLPALALMIAATFAYHRWGTVPAVGGAFRGMAPAVAAVIVAVAVRLGSANVKSRAEATLAAGAALLFLGMGASALVQPFRTPLTVLLLAGCGLWGFRASPTASAGKGSLRAFPWAELAPVLALVAALVACALAPLPLAPRAPARIFLTFAGQSVMLFGGGYVFIPIIQDIVVSQHGWVTQQQFIDGIALGQLTPGPILISASFIAQTVMTADYGPVAGVVGAVIAAVSIFAPPAIVMVASVRLLDLLKESATTKAVLRGVRLGVVGMVFAAGAAVLHLAVAQGQPFAIAVALVIFVGALVAQLRFKLDVIWVIPTAGIVGTLLLH